MRGRAEWERAGSESKLADRLDLEVKGDEGKDEALQVLDEVVEHLQAVGVLALGRLDERADLRGLIAPYISAWPCADNG